MSSQGLYKRIFATFSRPVQREIGNLSVEARVALQNAVEHSNRELESESVHDILNLLNGIIGYSAFHLEEVDFESLPDDLRGIHSSAQRLYELFKESLEISRAHEINPETIQLGTLLDQYQQKFLQKRRDEIIYHNDSKRLITGDRQQIWRIIDNLLGNALYATRESGVVTIGVSDVNLDRKHQGHHTIIPAGEYELLTVADTGTGIPPEMLEPIFDRFYTTKGEEGNGLGLSVVKKFTYMNNGFINVISSTEEPSGTTFQVYFPALTES